MQVTGEGPRGPRALGVAVPSLHHRAATCCALARAAPRGCWTPAGRGGRGRTRTPNPRRDPETPRSSPSSGAQRRHQRARFALAMPSKMEKFLQIAPHSLAIVLGPTDSPADKKPAAVQPSPPVPAEPRQLSRHHIGYEIFADFKAENMQHFWNKKVTAAVAETFFLGWIDEQVLLIQGKEEHLEALREGWTRRALRPPSGFQIRCLGEWVLPPRRAAGVARSVLAPEGAEPALRPGSRGPRIFTRILVGKGSEGSGDF